MAASGARRGDRNESARFFQKRTPSGRNRTRAGTAALHGTDSVPAGSSKVFPPDRFDGMERKTGAVNPALVDFSWLGPKLRNGFAIGEL
jgi:hypothetical protein